MSQSKKNKFRISREQFSFFMDGAFTDVGREIQLGRISMSEKGKRALGNLSIALGGGNFLAALGLLCWTELGGKLRHGYSSASRNFNAFFDDLGDEYRKFRAGHNVYDIFRCGMAHEYYVKSTFSIAMFGSRGIGYQDGRYFFVVERYALDLQRAFSELEAELYPNGTEK